MKCEVDSIIAELDEIGIEIEVRQYGVTIYAGTVPLPDDGKADLADLIAKAHNAGFREGVAHRDGDSGSGGDDIGGSSPDTPAPTGPGVSGESADVGTTADRNRVDRMLGAGIIRREDITPVSPEQFIQGILW